MEKTFNDIIKDVLSTPEMKDIVEVVEHNADVLDNHDAKLNELAATVESHARDLETIAEKLKMEDEQDGD